jgi:hypothetical protein
MLQGSALVTLHFPGTRSFQSDNDDCGAADLFCGLKDPTVTLPSLKLARLDGPGVKGLVSFLLVATSLRHLTITNLVQIQLMSACRQNGSLHSISVSHTIDNNAESSAEWASSHAWCKRLTTAICSRNKELPLLLSGNVSLDNETSSVESLTLKLFPLLVFVAQQSSRMGPNAVFAGLHSSNCDTIGPERNQKEQAIGNKRLLQCHPMD